MSYYLDIPLKSEYPRLLEIWECSVRATHHFVIEEDIFFFKNLITENRMFEMTNIVTIRDGLNIAGFMGTTEESLDMIFVGPEYIGKGAGKMLMRYAIDELNVTRVDVNEQNVHALKFYLHFGFMAAGRSELDSNGKPYPILHMQLRS